MPNNTHTNHIGNETVKDKRIALLNEVEELRQDVRAETGMDLDFIKANVNRAEVYLLNDGEYNYNVRLALTQLTHAVAGADGGQEATVERIDKIRKQLETKAQLPAPEQAER